MYDSRSSKSEVSKNNRNCAINVTNASDNIPETSYNACNTSMKDPGSDLQNCTTLGLVKRGLRIGNLNVRHILPKIDEIEHILQEKRSVDIFGICETFLNDKVTNNELNIDGFTFERRDRKSREGGGVLVYVSNKIDYKRREDIETGETESIWIEINLPHTKPILFCSVYRPPNSPTEWIDTFETEVMKASSPNNPEIIIAGDLNIDMYKNDT